MTPSHRLRWYLLVACIAPVLGIAAALSVLLLSAVQTDTRASGALIIAPLAVLPLAGLLIVDRLAKRAVTFDRMLGALMFLALAVFGEFSVGYWIESLHHP